MIQCPDSERLTSIEQAAEWELSDLVDHFSTCAECRESLLALETLHAELAAVADVRPGFTEEIMDAVDSRSAAGRRYPSPVDLVNVGLAGLTAAFSLAIAASGGVTAASAAAILAGGLVAAAFYALADVFVTDHLGSR